MRYQSWLENKPGSSPRGAPRGLSGQHLRAWTPPAALNRSIVVQDGADATILGEQRVAAEPEQVERERLVGLLLAVALDFDGESLRYLAGGEGQRAGLGDLVGVPERGVRRPE